MKVNPGRSFSGMLNDVEGIGRIYLRSETVMEGISQIP
jgi:hypothetical protein